MLSLSQQNHRDIIMQFIFGYFVVVISLFGIFAIAGGHIVGLLQPIEFFMIIGGTTGVFLAGNSSNTIKSTFKVLPTALKGGRYSKAYCVELIALLHEILGKTNEELMSIEDDLKNPQSSKTFTKLSKIVSDQLTIEFLANNLRTLKDGNISVNEMGRLMNVQIEAHHLEAIAPANAIAELKYPTLAFGIASTVLSIIYTLESVGIPLEEMGMLTAHGLVGTFLGILLAYGFVAPLGRLLAQRAGESTMILQSIKVALLAKLNGCSPMLAVELGRSALHSSIRPGQSHQNRSAAKA